jgi:ceramide glucosyltransferase
MTGGVILSAVGLGGLFLSVVSFAIAASALRRHRRKSRGRSGSGFLPPVSIVKPLSGLDDELARNLESFYRLDYPEYEIVFSFARENDPAFAVARRAADAHPEIRTVFVVDGHEAGLNAKVNRLAAGVRRARHPYFLFSDGNVRVERAFLRRAISFFEDSRVGLVSNLFAAAGAVTLGSRIESLHLNGFLQAGTAFLVDGLGRTCVVGKSILMSREALNAIGGFAPLRDHLAEDFLLGEKTRDAGFAVRLSADEVDTAEVGKSLRSAWDRHRRWAILRVRLGGFSYASEILASPALWFAAAAAGAAALGGRPGLAVACAGGILWGARIGVEARLAAGAGRPLAPRDLPLVVMRDLAVAGLFWAGLLGRRTRWRGRDLFVGPRTLLEPIEPHFRQAVAMAE